MTGPAATAGGAALARPGPLALAAALLAGALLCFGPAPAGMAFEPSGKLEIHYINIGQGGSTLIIGPNGTRVLYDFGDVPGRLNIVPYLEQVVGLEPADGLHYTIVSHKDQDHYFGFKDVFEAGYQATVANYESGSKVTEGARMKSHWLNLVRDETLPEHLRIRPLPLATHIALGDGAEIIVVAVNGSVYGETEVTPLAKTNKNDRSISLLIRYGKFHYVLDGDLGAGPDDCSGHQTSQLDLQNRVANALIKKDLIPEEHGVDVMHVAHHGSESSTSAAYFDLMKPEVGLISVGKNQGTFLHPREDVVDKLLLQSQPTPEPDCVHAYKVVAVFQTEEGEAGESDTGRTSFSGTVLGDIKLVTDGLTGYTIFGNNRQRGPIFVAAPFTEVLSRPFDEDAGPTN